jgi:acyl dehydratase
LDTGQTLTAQRTFSQRDFDRFAALSGDDNPIHVDPAFTARTKFGRTVAHGMFLYSNLCSLWGSCWPGPGTVQLGQDLIFPSPTYVGETVTMRLEVGQVDGDTVTLKTDIERPSGDLGLQGQTRLILPGKPLFKRRQVPSPRQAYPDSSERHRGLTRGMKAEMSRAFTPTDLVEYADLAQDTNPILSDPAFARQQGLEGPLIPGGLLGGLFSYLLGTVLPGRGTNWLKQRLVFPAPAYTEEEIRAVVEITRLRPEKDLVNLRTVCSNPSGVCVCEGEALVWVGDLEAED